MRSPNKPSMTVAEREHVTRVKAMPCAVCGTAGPSEAHEIEQGLWWLAIPLCPDCHRGQLLGLHGQKRAWTARKLTEMDALNQTIKAML